MGGMRASALCIALLLAACGGGGGGGGDAAPIGPFTISGTITPASGSTVDSDINDTLVISIPNPVANPQAIRNPATVGGYVNMPGTGSPGSSSTVGDESDFFGVALEENQVVTLSVAEHPNADIDLFLYRASDPLTAVLDSQGSNGLESVTVPVGEGDDYLIEVRAVTGATNYTLTVGQTLPGGLSDTAAEFVPGEIIVRLSEDPIVSGVQASADRLSSLGLTKARGRAPSMMLMRLGDREQRNRTLRALGAEPQERPGKPIDATEQLRRDTLAAVAALRLRSDIAYAEPNYIRRPTLAPIDAFYPLQWHYPLINLPQAWDLTVGDRTPNVIVAVIDTGVLLGHPDLQGQLVAGYDFISDDASSGDGEPGIDDNPDDPGDGANPDGSSSFHGTHVAGTVAALTNNTDGVGGVAWSARIMPLRALAAFGTDYDIAQAVRFAAGLPNDSNTFPSQRADVINMSLGAPIFSATLCNAVSAARAEGVVVVASAGNDGDLDPVYPAACDGAVSVSAVTIDKQLASYSSFGSTIDVGAPGGSGTDLNSDGNPDAVLSTVGQDSGGSIQFGYGFAAGTSMAAPHVAGVIALMEAIAPDDLTPDEFDGLLQNGQITLDLGDPGRDDSFGWGLIDALKAVTAAQAPSVTPLLTVSPATLFLGSSGVSANLSVRNSGGGTLTVDIPTTDQSWLNVTPQSEITLSAGASQIYTATVDRSGLVDGSYSGTISFTSDAGGGPIGIAVSMQVLTGASEDDAGQQYVLLVDPISLETAGVAIATLDRGVYNFTISDVPSGEYQLYTGSDMDNDFSICDPGEACGAYLSLDLPTTLTVNANLTDLDFETAFQVSIPTTTGLGTTVHPRAPLGLGTSKN